MAITLVEVVTIGKQGVPGIPGASTEAGGTTSQVLAKASNLDYDAEWIDVNGSNVLFTSAEGLASTNIAGAVDEVEVARQVIDLSLTVRDDKVLVDLNTILARGLYQVEGANLPSTETEGLLEVIEYDLSTVVEQFIMAGSGTWYRRVSALGTGLDWTVWTEDTLSAKVTWNKDWIVTDKAYMDFAPQLVAPAYKEGRIRYDEESGSFKVMGPFSNIEAELGHGEHIHVVNNSGAVIEKGMACRHNGVAGGKVQVVKAIATTFDNARVFGVAAADIPNGGGGALVTSGAIDNLNTNLLPVGQPLYLSDTVAGTYGPDIPDIVSQVGGAIIADALIGKFYVQLINNTNLPTVYGGLSGLTVPLRAITTSPVVIAGYVLKESVVTLADISTGGVTLPNDGFYRANVVAYITFPSTTSTRSITVQLYNQTGALMVFPYVKNIPRDATSDSFSFSIPFSALAGNVYQLRVLGSESINVTFNSLVFDIESISIK